MWKKGLRDDNKLLDQEKQSGIALIKKYKSRKLKPEPTEVMKYYEYETYQRPILDELNYVSERMKTENINKQKTDFDFIEDLKIKREKEMKERAKNESDIDRLKKELFGGSSVKSDDMTPTITSELELESRSLSREQLEKMKRKSEIRKEQSALIIEKAILSKVKRDRANKPPTEEEVLTSMVEETKKRGRGRPKGSKDTQPRKSRLPEVPQAIGEVIQEAIPKFQMPSAPELEEAGFTTVKRRGKKKSN